MTNDHPSTPTTLEFGGSDKGTIPPSTKSATIGSSDSPKKLTKPRRASPVRPPKSPYNCLNLLQIPRRLFRPPTPTIENVPTLAKHTTGVVRSHKRVSLKDVQLKDVLEGQHLPPLTVKDFEDYLCFVELAAENLYFEAFYKEYKRLYALGTPENRSPDSNLALLELYHIALDSFFQADSPLEVNVPGDLRRSIDQQVAALPTLKTEPFLPPSAFEKVYATTHDSLETSFQKFLIFNVRNAERNRGRFAKFVGGMTFLLGFIPTIVCAVLDKNRAWRALGIPIWWFGTVVFMGGVHKTCLVVYLFGDNRQLRPWELMRPSASSSSASSINSPSTTSSPFNFFKPTGSPDSYDLEKGGSNYSPPSLTYAGDDRFYTGATGAPQISPSFLYSNTFSYFPVRRNSSDSVPTLSTIDGTQRERQGSQGSIWFEPTEIRSDLMVSSPTFASLTPVVDPIVKRAQWETVSTAALYALGVAAIMSAICLSVPNRHH
ncbi:hypothetical protein T439DRAFT_330136 [Meredithblackwellia eburnea MCA 4105]